MNHLSLSPGIIESVAKQTHRAIEHEQFAGMSSINMVVTLRDSILAQLGDDKLINFVWDTYQILAGLQPQGVAVHLSQLHRRVHEPGVLGAGPGPLADELPVDVGKVGVEPTIVGKVCRVGVEVHLLCGGKVPGAVRAVAPSPGLGVSNSQVAMS